jgi:primosomal protein N' (replication factor Y)
VIQALAQEFPELRALRFDSDTTRHKHGHRQLLTQFANEDIDLLVGTQMLTKGIDLPQVRLVAVLAADGLLFQSNYRSAERAFQTLTQVAGRAGRDQGAAQVIIQTYNPEHPVINAVKTHNYQEFIAQELPQRQELNYPPYGKLILFKLTSPSPIAVEKTAHHLATVCLDRLGDWCDILGPAPAQVMRVKDQFRWQLLLKFAPEVSDRLGNLSEFNDLCPYNVRLAIDVDPLQMA